MAINLFKSQLLKEQHIPNQAQAVDVLNALSTMGMDETFDQRTWRGWFGENARRARVDSIGAIDKVALMLPSTNPHIRLPNVQPNRNFFAEMTEGGLCKELLTPTASKRPKYAILQKADEYDPISALHLHLDAIEAVALAEPNGDANWETVKAIAAGRVLNILHSRWNPRHGSIYPKLSSNLRIEWDQASKNERERIQHFYARMVPNRFAHCMSMAATPDWSCTDVEVDIGPAQAHRMLFALSADVDFLVADRFEAWALDLATAALAMLARAFTDRYNTFGASVGPELIYWDAFEALFFREESAGVIFDSLHRVMEYSGASFSLRSFELLAKAGTKYKQTISKLGVSHEMILDLTSRCWAVHPLVYHLT